MTKLPFFFLAILAISSFAQMAEVAEADALDCSVLFQLCSGSCWKSGRCQECCKHYGFPDGKCSLKHGDGCYCCSSSSGGGAGGGPEGFLV
ncbi:hypothetical protein PAHAL_7G012600 [Panicum hallii]|uniref:Knottin scorpion toxin-like domain-containing protein n=1 Tax=Panicum hallii TaxID=206008 RepID=A0A2T8IAK0_9POAL|nr:hypothetical protein PAHAL_7G012600 [Panicum hallii]